jgi:uncharacterized protein (TIGR03083 family)
MARGSDSLTPGVDATDVIAARDLVLAFMRPLATRDWTSPIPDLEWDCEVTLRHMIRAQTIYAAHLATRSTKRLQLSREVDPGLSIEALLDNLYAQISVLAAVLRDAPPEARGWHNSGMTDPGGFSAISCDELLVHTWDIGRGFGESFELPGDICGRVVARLFPQWPPIDADPRHAFLWCNGRIALADRPRQSGDWLWWSRPLEEWNGSFPDE